MAEKKYLDAVGLTEMWSKIKAWLGGGVFNNQGEFNNYFKYLDYSYRFVVTHSESIEINGSSQIVITPNSSSILSVGRYAIYFDASGGGGTYIGTKYDSSPEPYEDACRMGLRVTTVTGTSFFIENAKDNKISIVVVCSAGIKSASLNSGNKTTISGLIADSLVAIFWREIN